MKVWMAFGEFAPVILKQPSKGCIQVDIPESLVTEFDTVSRRFSDICFELEELAYKQYYSDMGEI